MVSSIVRQHQSGDTDSEAIYSECGCYRYLLTRTWDVRKPRMMYIMLNPSTATEAQNDPTIERCERRARMLGFGAIRIGNLFSLRATDPEEMKIAPDPVGPLNDAHLMTSLDEWQPDLILCGWGAHGSHLDRETTVLLLLRSLGCVLSHLGLTKHGMPRHPLYISYAMKPQVWA